MPFSFRNFRSVKTNLKLNGPVLRYVLNPKDTQESFDGSAVFNATAIAEFPETTLNADGGYTFEWYYDNNKVDSSNEFIEVSSFNSSSQLTITDIDYLDEGKEVYCLVYYNPALNEGKPINSPLKSDIATLSAYPEIVITKQPEDQKVGNLVDAEYSCDSDLTPTATTPQDQEYRWQIDGVDLEDGTFDVDGLVPTADVLNVTSNLGDNFQIDFNELSMFKGFLPNRTYTIFSTTDVKVRLFAIGGGGGGSGYNKIKGSSGGSVQGDFTFLAGQSYKLQVGAAGGNGADYENGTLTVPGGFPGGGDSPSLGTSENRAGGGGGYTGLFLADDPDGDANNLEVDPNKVSQENAILIAGGGGGSTSKPSRGGDGGGNSSVLGLGDLIQDSDGNLLIFASTGSALNVVQTTGRVEYGSNTCIDDTRWQAILDYAQKNDGVKLFGTLDNSSTVVGRATNNNIRAMMNANALPLRRSLTGWVNTGYAYPLYALAWDENSGGMHGYGVDYSILSWANVSYRFGYYGHSRKSFFSPTSYSNATANWWLTIPGGNSVGTSKGTADGIDSDTSGSGGGFGGTLTAGGSGGIGHEVSGAGGALQGGTGEATVRGSAGGGGGYFGGGAGDSTNNGGGGGGSGYINDSLVTDASFSRENSVSESKNVGNNGSFKIKKIADTVTSTITVSGSGTKNLTLNSNSSLFGSEVRCKISSNKAQFTPIFTEPANFQSITPRPVIVMEAYDTVNGTFQSKEINLESETYNGEFSLDSDTFGSSSNIITFYSKETGFQYYLKVSASAGSDKSSHTGGEGGVSFLRIDAKKGVEYTIIGVSNNSAIFIYEKSRLIAVVGQGGSAGTEGDGGDGGGVNVDGIPGFGRNPGLGGSRPVTGTLELTGSFGSILSGANISLYSGDTIKTQQEGGKTISCTKGSYYINQGLSPCEDISENPVQFIDNSGRVYSESSSIIRGFKSGYTITDTAGKGADDSCGNGGNGATGGDGGTNKSGGGGGSGYADDSIVVIDTVVGGNKDKKSSILFSNAPIPLTPPNLLPVDLSDLPPAYTELHDAALRAGTLLYVDSNRGSNTNDGKTTATALASISRAVQLASNGWTIFVLPGRHINMEAEYLRTGRSYGHGILDDYGKKLDFLCFPGRTVVGTEDPYPYPTSTGSGTYRGNGSYGPYPGGLINSGSRAIGFIVEKNRPGQNEPYLRALFSQDAGGYTSPRGLSGQYLNCVFRALENRDAYGTYNQPWAPVYAFEFNNGIFEFISIGRNYFPGNARNSSSSMNNVGYTRSSFPTEGGIKIDQVSVTLDDKWRSSREGYGVYEGEFTWDSDTCSLYPGPTNPVNIVV